MSVTIVGSLSSPEKQKETEVNIKTKDGGTWRGKERKKKRVIREIKHLTSKIVQSKDGDFVLGIITSPAENEKER